jgi:hypothetical protein
VKNVFKNTQAFLQGHTDRVSCLAVSSDGKRLASGQDIEMGFKVRRHALAVLLPRPGVYMALCAVSSVWQTRALVRGIGEGMCVCDRMQWAAPRSPCSLRPLQCTLCLCTRPHPLEKWHSCVQSCTSRHVTVPGCHGHAANCCLFVLLYVSPPTGTRVCVGRGGGDPQRQHV